MSAFTEKRAHPRIDVDGKVRFKGIEMEDFEEGELKNVSASGILLLTPRQFQLGDILSVVLAPDEPGADPIEMQARIVRNHISADDALIGYGCLILDATEFD